MVYDNTLFNTNHLLKFQEMGRPNTATKRAKRRRQKTKRYSQYKSAPHSTNMIDISDDSLNDITSSNSVNDNAEVHLASPLLFSDPTPPSPTISANAESNPDPPGLDGHMEHSHMQDLHDAESHKDLGTTVRNTCTELGDADTDTIEMDHYDSFRKENGDIHSNEYLLKCRDKLKKKYQHANEEIHWLRKENLKIKLETKYEKERIHQFYKTSFWTVPNRINGSRSLGYFTCCRKSNATLPIGIYYENKLMSCIQQLPSIHYTNVHNYHFLRAVVTECFPYLNLVFYNEKSS